MSSSVDNTKRLLRHLVPAGRELVIRTPPAEDECHWFGEAVDRALVQFTECPVTCFRRVKWEASGPDHFETTTGAPRHLFSSPHGRPSLNREYLPHIAAWARAVYDFGYDAAGCRFSFYRRYRRNLLTKRIGGSFETDIEFDDAEGRLHLQVEAKKDAAQVERLAAQLDGAGSLADLPLGSAKEIEYVLDLAPRYLWGRRPRQRGSRPSRLRRHCPRAQRGLRASVLLSPALVLPEPERAARRARHRTARSRALRGSEAHRAGSNFSSAPHCPARRAA